jgi:hypothetical protein
MRRSSFTWRLRWILLCGCLAVSGSLASAQPVFATFASTSVKNVLYDPLLRHNIPDLLVSTGGASRTVPFLQTYQATGGLTRWGLPTSEVMEETAGNLVQYYQRGVMEWHTSPTCNPAGSYCMERKLTWDCFGGGACGSTDLGVEPGQTNPNAGDLLGPWGHKVSDFAIDGTCTGQLVGGECHGFRWFFNQWGGVDAFGFPKSDARSERYDLGPPAPGTLYIDALAKAGTDGPRIRQYFQAAVMEFHPDDASDPIKLRLLGDDLRDKLYPASPAGSWKAFRSFRDAASTVSGAAYDTERVFAGPRQVQAMIGYGNHITETCLATNWQPPAQSYCGWPSPTQPSQPASQMPFVSATVGTLLLTGDVLRTRTGSPDYVIHAVLEMIKDGLLYGFLGLGTNAQVETGPTGGGAEGVTVQQGDVGVLTSADASTLYGTPDTESTESGTLFLINVSGSPGATTTTIKVVEGQLKVRPRGVATAAAIAVGANEQIVVARGRLLDKSTAHYTSADSIRIQYLQLLKPLLGTKPTPQLPPVPTTVISPLG